MLIRRQVAVKVIVTEDFKRELIERLRQAMEKDGLSRELLESQGLGHVAELHDADPEKTEVFRRAVKAGLAQRLTTAERLDIGSEYHQGTLEGLVEIRPGDMLQEKVHGAEIVIKDGCVVEIRND